MGAEVESFLAGDAEQANHADMTSAPDETDRGEGPQEGPQESPQEGQAAVEVASDADGELNPARPDRATAAILTGAPMDAQNQDRAGPGHPGAPWDRAGPPRHSGQHRTADQQRTADQRSRPKISGSARNCPPNRKSSELGTGMRQRGLPIRAPPSWGWPPSRLCDSTRCPCGDHIRELQRLVRQALEDRRCGPQDAFGGAAYQLKSETSNSNTREPCW